MKAFVRVLVPVVAIGWATPSNATLTMEPVINFAPGSGPSADSLPFYNPDFVNSANGEHPFLANEPGEIDTVSIGYPPDPFLATAKVLNNTAYDLTSLKLSIVGTATHPTGEQFSWLVTRDPGVDAVWGDANGDGKIGVSDIYSSFVVSADGKTVTLSGGVIPAGGHFIDSVASITTNGLPFNAAVDTSFGGVLAVVPEPTTGALLLTGLGLLWAIRNRNRHPT